MSELLYPSLWKGCVGAWCPSRQRARGVSTLIDHSPFNNHGTLTNMDPGTDWVPSEGKYALDFDGTNDTVTAALPAVSIPISFSFWIKISSTQVNNYPIFLYNASPSLQFGFGLPVVPPGRIFFKAGTYFNYSVTPIHDTWAHLAVVYESSQTSLYVNGAFLESGAAASITNLRSLTIAGGAAGLYFTGLQDDIRPYNRSLTPSEIKTLSLRRGIAYETQRRTRAYVAGGGPASNTPQLMLLGVG